MVDSTACPRVVIGLDLSDRQAHVFALDGATGEVLEDGKVATKAEVFEARFRGYESARVILEAGTHSPWIFELLVKLGHEVLVANPRRLQIITESDKKSDRLDAQMLAELGRTAPQLLSPVWNRGRDLRGHLSVIRARDLLVQSRTALVNHVRSTVKTFGGRVGKCDARSFHKHAGEEIPDVAMPALKPLLVVLENVDVQIKAYDQQITELAKTVYPETAQLQQVAGVGPIIPRAPLSRVGRSMPGLRSRASRSRRSTRRWTLDKPDPRPFV